MNGQRATLTLVVVLAVLAVAGIVGMLLAENPAADGAAFLVATLPLVVAAWACWARRGTS
ncbi:MAG TPA: hypothetical protein VIS07_07900 [Candidatus Binatia bacterium]